MTTTLLQPHPLLLHRSSRSAALPPLPPPPFPEPKILNAKRHTGLVRIPDPEDDSLELHWQTSCSSLDDSMVGPGIFHRRNSTTGNILLIEHDDINNAPSGGNEVGSTSTKAYWLQRKISKTTHGSVRVGFVLRFRPAEERTEDEMEQWELTPSNTGDIYPFEMVAIKMQDRSKILIPKGDDPIATEKDPLAEVCALQMLDSYYKSRQQEHGEKNKHVVSTHEIAADNNFLYIVMPFHRQGSLFQYCVERGRLRESEARHFFTQVIEGIETMRAVGLCHRDLAMENILLNGADCCIAGLGYSVPIPRVEGTGLVHLAKAQPNYVKRLQYAPPEVLRNEPFDTEDVDLWAAGIILLSMLFGTDVLFIGPVEEDRKFRGICIKGNLKYLAEQWEQDSDLPPVSQCALDLLQAMLRADPKNRLLLNEIKLHPWLSGGTD